MLFHKMISFASVVTVIKQIRGYFSNNIVVIVISLLALQLPVQARTDIEKSIERKRQKSLEQLRKLKPSYSIPKVMNITVPATFKAQKSTHYFPDVAYSKISEDYILSYTSGSPEDMEHYQRFMIERVDQGWLIAKSVTYNEGQKTTIKLRFVK